MRSRTIVVPRRRRRKLLAWARRTKDARLRVRIMIVVLSGRSWGAAKIAEALGCCERSVTRVRARWRREGEAGLIDRREDNGQRKVEPVFLRSLVEVLGKTPRDFGHRRPTWTRRLLILTLRRLTRMAVSPTTMSGALRRVGARLGRPRPTVSHLGWPEQAKKRRLAALRRLIATLPPDEAAVYEDEVDIDLNPRIGHDWMLPGTQRIVPTPGKNQKRYLAGALDAKSHRLVWVKGERKDSGLFIAMLSRLLRRYRDKKKVHVILDNYGIHVSKRTQAFLAEHSDRLRLHPLPPYCPDENRIERLVWRELHQNVTYSHDCETMEELMHEAESYLIRRDRELQRHGLSESRAAI